MKYLYLITTEGCQGCKIMKDILINNFSDIRIRIQDVRFVPMWIKVNVKLTDFPTLVFIKNDIIRYHFSGTKSARKIKELIETLQF